MDGTGWKLFLTQDQNSGKFRETLTSVGGGSKQFYHFLYKNKELGSFCNLSWWELFWSSHWYCSCIKCWEGTRAETLLFEFSKVGEMFCNFAADSRILTGSQAFLYPIVLARYKWICSLKRFHNMNKNTLCYSKHIDFYFLLLLSVALWSYSLSLLTLDLIFLSLLGPSLFSVVDGFPLAAASHVYLKYYLGTCTGNLLKHRCWGCSQVMLLCCTRYQHCSY